MSSSVPDFSVVGLSLTRAVALSTALVRVGEASGEFSSLSPKLAPPLTPACRRQTQYNLPATLVRMHYSDLRTKDTLHSGKVCSFSERVSAMSAHNGRREGKELPRTSTTPQPSTRTNRADVPSRALSSMAKELASDGQWHVHR